jgi:hypothetical protein
MLRHQRSYQRKVALPGAERQALSSKFPGYVAAGLAVRRLVSRTPRGRTIADLAELISVSRTTVYRALDGAKNARWLTPKQIAHRAWSAISAASVADTTAPPAPVRSWFAAGAAAQDLLGLGGAQAQIGGVRRTRRRC